MNINRKTHFTAKEQEQFDNLTDGGVWFTNGFKQKCVALELRLGHILRAKQNAVRAAVRAAVPSQITELNVM